MKQSEGKRNRLVSLSAFLFSFKKIISPKRQKAGKENDDKKERKRKKRKSNGAKV